MGAKKPHQYSTKVTVPMLQYQSHTVPGTVLLVKYQSQYQIQYKSHSTNGTVPGTEPGTVPVVQYQSHTVPKCAKKPLQAARSTLHEGNGQILLDVMLKKLEDPLRPLDLVLCALQAFRSCDPRR